MSNRLLPMKYQMQKERKSSMIGRSKNIFSIGFNINMQSFMRKELNKMKSALPLKKEKIFVF